MPVRTNLPTGSTLGGAAIATAADTAALDARVDALESAPPGSVGLATTTVAGAVKIASASGDPVVPLTTDPRLSDARAPTAHAALHGSAGADPVTVAQSQVTGLGTALAAKVDTTDARLADARPPLAHTHSAADVTSGTLALARLPTGTTGTTVALGNDPRFSDARTPTAHAASHATGGTDALSPASIGAAAATHAHAESDVTNLVSDLAAKAPLASPTFTGNPTAPTPAFGDADTSLATTAFVKSATEAITALAADTATIGTSLTAVPTLSCAVAASEVWLVEWELAVVCATTTATIGLSVTGPAGAAGIVTVDGQNGAPNTGAAAGKSALVALGTAVATGQFGNPGSATLPTSLRVSAAVRNGGTAGTVSLNLQASAGTLTVKANSFMRARRVS